MQFGTWAIRTSRLIKPTLEWFFAEQYSLGKHPRFLVSYRITVYMDPYGRFFLSEGRGTYPVMVELEEGYRLTEDPSGGRRLVGPDCSMSEITSALRSGVARMI
jgi:hypothetical protein